MKHILLSLWKRTAFAAVFLVLFAVALAGQLLAIGAMHAYQAAHTCGLPMAPLVLAVDNFTQLADLWVPSVWQRAKTEAKIKAVGFFSSGVVISDPEINTAASGAGTDVQIPFFIEPNPADEVQLERTAPNVNKLTSGLQRATILNRVHALGGTALAKAVSGADPISEILTLLDGIRKRQRATALQSQLAALFGTGAAPAAATGAMRALRLDNFVEILANVTNSHLISSNMVLDAIQLMGEAKTRIEGGVFLCHSQIATNLNKQDDITTVYDSQGKFVMKTYKGMMVVEDDRLTRAGTGAGTPPVYFSFICARGSVVTGEKPQIVTDQAGEVAAIQLDAKNLSLNEQVVYDRTRYILHVQGAKWNPQAGVPANAADKAGTASNAELADPANWQLAFADARNVGIVLLRTNG